MLNTKGYVGAGRRCAPLTQSIDYIFPSVCTEHKGKEDNHGLNIELFRGEFYACIVYMNGGYS